ncbi:hypothetical protein O181_028477 [Austropuccinia psidii MF-1]|uniref:Uncharacterized protein n=1 Tax=Austropuccinia psidii MF-1 TaxID=1389203 RepID=A0A9Q3CUN1_9BASI|nr:hypothetical protein [Austropuccinia psidii MF-1]
MEPTSPSTTCNIVDGCGRLNWRSCEHSAADHFCLHNIVDGRQQSYVSNLVSFGNFPDSHLSKIGCQATARYSSNIMLLYLPKQHDAYHAGPQLTNDNTVWNVRSMACNCINVVMHIFNVQPKTMDLSTSDPITSPISRRNTQISVPDLTVISMFLSNIKGPSMDNQQHINPLLFVNDFLTDTDSSAPNYKTGVPSSSDSNTKLGSNPFGSDSRIYHPMELDMQSSEELEQEDNKYLIANDSGLGVNDDTPPKRQKAMHTIKRIQLF